MQLGSRLGLRDQVADGGDPQRLPVRLGRVRLGPPVPGDRFLDEAAQVVQQERERGALLRPAGVSHERDVRAAAGDGRQQVTQSRAAGRADPGVDGSPPGDGRGLPLARVRVLRERGPDRADVLVQTGLGDRPASRDVVQGELADFSGQAEADRGQSR
jgi:hypothetical protein